MLAENCLRYTYDYVLAYIKNKLLIMIIESNLRKRDINLQLLVVEWTNQRLRITLI